MARLSHPREAFQGISSAFAAACSIVRRGLPPAAEGLRRLTQASLDVLSPGFCRACGGGVPSGSDPLCPACLGAIRWITSACPRCATPLVRPPLDGCGLCAPRGFRFDRAAAGGQYRGPLRTAILRFKFRRDAGVLGLLTGALLRAAESGAVRSRVGEAGAIVPVPTHPLRRWWRGWDPAAELALGLSSRLGGAPPVVHLLRKVRWTSRQVGLELASRRRNLRRAFRAATGRAVPPVVLLVDDVLTTGTTASECAQALKTAGAREVVVLAVARS